MTNREIVQDLTKARKQIISEMVDKGKAELADIEAGEVKNANTLAELASVHIDAYSKAGHARKEKYHSLARRKLRKLANALGLTANNYSLRSNKGGIAVCGEITLHTDTLYIQVSQSCFGKGREIMFRRCNGRKDYCGMQNNFADISMLDRDPAELIARLRRTGALS